MSLVSLFRFNKRPQVDTQNTGRDVFERPFDVATVSANGMGGAGNFRSLSPVSPTGFNKPMVATAALTGVGNDLNTNPFLDPLSNKDNSQF